MLQLKAWAPYLSGMLIGSLQVPLMFIIGETLGGSSSFTVILAQVMIGPFRRLSSYIAKHRWGFDVWWQVSRPTMLNVTSLFHCSIVCVLILMHVYSFMIIILI